MKIYLLLFSSRKTFSLHITFKFAFVHNYLFLSYIFPCIQQIIHHDVLNVNDSSKNIDFFVYFIHIVSLSLHDSNIFFVFYPFTSFYLLCLSNLIYLQQSSQTATPRYRFRTVQKTSALAFICLLNNVSLSTFAVSITHVLSTVDLVTYVPVRILIYCHIISIISIYNFPINSFCFLCIFSTIFSILYVLHIYFSVLYDF